MNKKLLKFDGVDVDLTIVETTRKATIYLTVNRKDEKRYRREKILETYSGIIENVHVHRIDQYTTLISVGDEYAIFAVMGTPNGFTGILVSTVSKRENKPDINKAVIVLTDGTYQFIQAASTEM